MPEDKFNKFTERGRKVLSLALEEARRFNHSYIGTEHMLLALVRVGDGVAAKVLNNLGVQLPTVRSAVEFTIGRGDSMVVGEIGLTPNARKVIENAVNEARRLNHHYIGTEHLLLGLLQVPEGVACGVLESLGVNLERARQQVLQVVSQSSGYQTHAGSGQASNVAPRGFERFTTTAHKVMALAQEEARLFNHGHIGTEHLLLGLLRVEDGIAAEVLHEWGVGLQKCRTAVEDIVGRGDGIVGGEIGLTPRARKVIELAADEARRLNHRYIGTEHLLLGILREGEGVAAGVLASFGIDLPGVRHRVLQHINETRSAQPSAGHPTGGPGAWSGSAAAASYQVASGSNLDRLKGLLDEPEGSYASPFTQPISIASVLRDMTPQNREALVLREFASLSMEDIGHVLGISRSATKAVLFRGRQEYRHLYQTARERESARTRVEQVVQAIRPGRFTVELDGESISVRHHFPWNEAAEANIRRAYAALVGWLTPEEQTVAEGETKPGHVRLEPSDKGTWISISLELLTATQ
ncbi:MAG TPA: Clp protease N-terminal domain-containing protein [Thermomicrobiaceae bacterium]|nr:Clp protease N-terminal domain-containing protein [Thermomicrobiaceae bacterium]